MSCGSLNRSTHPKNRTRVVFVVLEGGTAVPRSVGINVGLQSIICKCLLAAQGGRASEFLAMALRVDASNEARPLAVSIGHILAGDWTGGTSTLAIEEDQEDERAKQGDTGDHTDNDTSN